MRRRLSILFACALLVPASTSAEPIASPTNRDSASRSTSAHSVVRARERERHAYKALPLWKLRLLTLKRKLARVQPLLLTLPPESADRHRRLAGRIQDIRWQIRQAKRRRSLAVRRLLTFAKPLDAPVSSPYGWRGSHVHTGVDFDAFRRRDVHAPLAGVVTSVGWDSGYGLVVRMRHRDRITTLFAHLARVRVRVGQRVRKGVRIATAGSTGHATGTHLHFEVRLRHRLVNPLRIIGKVIR